MISRSTYIYNHFSEFLLLIVYFKTKKFAKIFVFVSILSKAKIRLNVYNHEERHDSPRSGRDALSKKC